MNHLFKHLPHAGIPFIIFVFFLILSKIPDLALCVPELIGYTALLTILPAFAVFCEKKASIRWSSGFILVFAAVLRFLFLFQNPELSDDIFRYLFDGAMLLGGHNPYAEAPNAVTTAGPAAAALIPLVNHAHLPTIYPPAAQLVFAAGAILGGTVGMKLILILMDLLSCGLILKLLKQLRLPAAAATLYAWHPLPVIEIAASGHIDAAALCFLLLALSIILYGVRIHKLGNIAVVAERSNRWKGIFVALTAGSCFAAAMLVKWVPLLFLPGFFLIIEKNSRKYWISGFGMAAILLTAPFWPDIQNSYSTLSVYLSHWEFSGFAFRMLRRITGAGQTARILLAVCGAVAVGVIYVNAGRCLLRHRHSAPDVSAGPEDTHHNFLPVLRSFYAAAMAWLLLIPTLHPWYALYLVCFLPFAGGPAGIVLSWSVFFAYRVQILHHLTGVWVEDDFTPMLIVAAPAAAWICHSAISRRLRSVFIEFFN